MTIPTYSRIDDSEIDPESPVTSSLMFRLRDNLLALLKIDIGETSPTFNIVPSILQIADISQYIAAAAVGGTTLDTSEFIVSVRSAQCETIEIGAVGALTETGGAYPTPPSHFMGYQSTAGRFVRGTISAISAVYSATVPSSVRVVGHMSANASPQFDVSLPLDNAFHTIKQGATTHEELQGRARYDATNVYLTLRLLNDFNFTNKAGFHLPLTRKSFIQK